MCGVRVRQGKLTGGEKDPLAPWRASLEEGMLKGSFVSELAIRLQCFVPASPESKGGRAPCERPRKPEKQRLQICEASY